MEKQLKNNYRYERKYILNTNQLNRLVSNLYSKNFFELFDCRLINNIYFDDYSFSSVKENYDGLSVRKKVRIRWYGDSFSLSNKKIEIKNKNEFLNSKESFDLGLLKINNLKSIKEFKTEILKLKKHKYTLSQLLNTKRATLFNSYKRSYFSNINKEIRITIDENLFYYSPITYSSYNENKIIVEAKFDKKSNFINDFDNLLITRYSKYVKGTVQTSFYSSNY